MEEKKKSIWPIVVVVFVGWLLVGAGIGNMFDAIDTGAAATIGLGAGFISMGAIWAYYRNK